MTVCNIICLFSFCLEFIWIWLLFPSFHWNRSFQVHNGLCFIPLISIVWHSVNGFPRDTHLPGCSFSVSLGVLLYLPDLSEWKCYEIQSFYSIVSVYSLDDFIYYIKLYLVYSFIYCKFYIVLNFIFLLFLNSRFLSSCSLSVSTWMSTRHLKLYLFFFFDISNFRLSIIVFHPILSLLCLLLILVYGNSSFSWGTWMVQSVKHSTLGSGSWDRAPYSEQSQLETIPPSAIPPTPVHGCSLLSEIKLF